MRRFTDERGQTIVLTSVVMLIVLGMAGFVIDVGAWFHDQRASQATVDAAALAGAQALPTDPSAALSEAQDYANQNGGSAGATFTLGSRWGVADNEITVDQSTPVNSFFTRFFGISPFSHSVRAKATAVAAPPMEAMYVAPITVNIDHPELSGPGCPCFGAATTIPLGKNGAPGSFTLVNLDYNDPTGTIGTSTLASWIQNGFDQYLPLGVYFSDSGAKWNNSTIQSAVTARIGTDLLFPVYDSLIGTGSNAEYHIVGWAAFHITGTWASGTSGSISGYFDDVIWKGVISPNGPGNPSVPDLGVYSVALVD